MAPIARSPLERAHAWVVTGPLGHLWSGAVTVAIAWGRYAVLVVRRHAGRAAAP